MAMTMYYFPKKIIIEHINYCKKFLGLDKKLIKNISTFPTDDYIVNFFTLFIFSGIASVLVAIIIIFSFINLPFEVKLIYLTFSQTLIVLAWIDFKNFMIPEEITLPLMIIGLTISVTELSPVTINDSVKGFLFPALIVVCMKTIKMLAEVFRVFPDKEFIGMGDIYLLSVCGAWLGMSRMVYMMMYILSFSLIYAVILRTRKIPLAVPICLSSATILLTQF